MAAVPATHPAEVGPVETMRAFLTAMAGGDTQAIAKLAVARPGMDVLTAQSEPMDEEHKADMAAELKLMPLHWLRAGDAMTVVVRGQPRTFKVDVTQDNDGIALIQMGEGAPPMELVHAGGQWRVDPRPLIAARQAAQRVRDKRKGAATQP